MIDATLIARKVEDAYRNFCTRLAPIEYLANAKCETWQRFLNEIFAGDQELIAWLQRLGGYCLTGDVREQILPVLWGSGANGKSTLLKALLGICGDYAMQAPASLLIDCGAQHPTDKASLFGKRLAVAAETGDGDRLDEEKIKALTGGDRISGRKMHQDFWEFDPTHKLLLVTNHRPRIRGTDHGMWRRVRLVPFTVAIPDDRQDKHLPDKLRGEQSGILAWLVQGCLDWQRHGLGLPASVQAATAQYRASEDTLNEFLETCCERDPEGLVGASELLDTYKRHTGDCAMSAKRLAGLLRERGFEPNRNRHGVKWSGLRLVA